MAKHIAELTTRFKPLVDQGDKGTCASFRHKYYPVAPSLVVLLVGYSELDCLFLLANGHAWWGLTNIRTIER